jgi:phosphoglycolate phosphatase-like HAD superfamily hydrolase
MHDPVSQLKAFEPRQDFFIGIDSDGCAFDSMEIKHKECFCPAFIKHFELQPVAKYAREVWEFVNLYSRSRGANRFRAVLLALDYLRERREVRERGVEIPRMEGLREWVERESKLGGPALEAEMARNSHPDLERAYAWSMAVNRAVEDIVFGVPPFPFLRESLERMGGKADVAVVSQTPGEALEREWREQEIDGFVRLIAGQEMGTKAEHIGYTAGGKYSPEKILMIGDAPGDLRAARANDALFYPIKPGGEEASWQRLEEEGLQRFFEGHYAGEYEAALVEEFDACLPERAPWE